MAGFRFIAGLGNPGSQYASTRHNAGFMVLDFIAAGLASREAGFEIRGGSWREKFGGAFCEVWLNGEKIALLKPLGFMNRSGGPVAELLRFYQGGAEDLLVVHDDIDIPVGSLRIKQGGGDGGHNGIKSIVSSLGSKDFFRARVGVGRPARPQNLENVEQGLAGAEGYSPDIADWVLGNFPAEERQKLPELFEQCALAFGALHGEGLGKAQNLFNR